MIIKKYNPIANIQKLLKYRKISTYFFPWQWLGGVKYALT